ncbi:MAG: hypothetical protein JST59_13040 [Actinobacteria bacterium]|nr:hypothetical protein [Actinomycetota bacterium]
MRPVGAPSPAVEQAAAAEVNGRHDSYLVVAKRDDEAVEMAHATDKRDDG